MDYKDPMSSSEEVVDKPLHKWSLTRKLVIGGGAILAVLGIALGVGLGVGLTRNSGNGTDSTFQRPSTLSNVTATYPGGIWQPSVGTSWQLVLETALDSTDPAGVAVWDIDLFANNASAIQALRANGAKVICYFSAGSREDWRPDAADFLTTDLGNPLAGWTGERWLNTSAPAVRAVMLARLDRAAASHCDGVDPDNVDGYDNPDNGLGLTPADAVDYLEFLAGAAHARNLSIGLKNAADVIPSVLPLMQWSVNEQCQQMGECASFAPFPAAGKPVFNVEYPKGEHDNSDKDVADSVRDRLCQGGAMYNLSTIIKNYNLDVWVEEC